MTDKDRPFPAATVTRCAGCGTDIEPDDPTTQLRINGRTLVFHDGCEQAIG